MGDQRVIRIVLIRESGPYNLNFPSMLNNELIHLCSEAVQQYFGDKVYMGKQKILSWGYAFILPKSSPLKASCFSYKYASTGAVTSSISQEDFLMTIAWCKDTGVLAKMLNKMTTTNQEHMPISKVDPCHPLYLNHLSPIFLVFGIGMGISILAFFFESILRRPDLLSNSQAGPG